MTRRSSQRTLFKTGVLALVAAAIALAALPPVITRLNFGSADGRVGEVAFGPDSRTLYCFSLQNAASGRGESFCLLKTVSASDPATPGLPKGSRRLDCWPEAVQALGNGKLVIGGKTVQYISPSHSVSRGELLLYDPARGRAEARYAWHEMPVRAIAVSPERQPHGDRDAGARTHELADLESGRVRGDVDRPHARALGRGGPPAVGDRVRPRCTGQFNERTNQSCPFDVNAIAFSPDGTRVVSGGADRRVRVWDVSGDTLAALGPLGDLDSADHNQVVVAVGFASGGTEVVSQDTSGLIQVRAFPSGEVVRQAELPTRPDKGIAATQGVMVLALGGELFAYSGVDYAVRLYDTQVAAANLGGAESVVTPLEHRVLVRRQVPRARLGDAHRRRRRAVGHRRAPVARDSLNAHPAPASGVGGDPQR